MDINDLFGGIMKSINQIADEIAEQRLQEKMQETGRGPENVDDHPNGATHDRLNGATQKRSFCWFRTGLIFDVFCCFGNLIFRGNL
jgi:hypothetical protein